MDSRQNVVSKLPLTRLCNEEGDLDAQLVRRIGKDEVADLLRKGGTAFVVADVGHPLRWIANNQLYIVWKNDVKPHLADRDATVHRPDNHPDDLDTATQ